MTTPICDFVNEYIKKNGVRAHMPGHKGKKLLGFEEYDITEISGADSLYAADGIIAESEKNASSLFGCDTFYSAEGSSLCIRAMIFLVMQYAKEFGKEKLIFASRNAHKVLLSALALTDMDVEWLPSDESYLSCCPDSEILDKMLSDAERKPCAVYITSPDYLGKICDIPKISKVCKKHGVLLCVDNAHGAYLKFLPESLHPSDLGADLCCDSAHKTLPVLTGGAYLHISGKNKEFFSKSAKDALALFGSTSPSYLILQSLDAANRYINDGYSKKLSAFCEKVKNLKSELIKSGFSMYGDEPLKICILAKFYGYKGYELSKLISEKNIECEFSDPDYLVLMLTPENKKEELSAIKNALLSIKKLPEINEKAPKKLCPERAMSVREAMFSKNEIVSVYDAPGRILADANVSCPPAVPVVVCGEIIDENALEAFEYYNIRYCKVIKD